MDFARLAFPFAVTAARAEAVDAFGVVTRKETEMVMATIGAAWFMRPTSSLCVPEEVPKMLTTHSEGNAWPFTSATCTMEVSTAPTDELDANSSRGNVVSSLREKLNDAGAAASILAEALYGSIVETMSPTVAITTVRIKIPITDLIHHHEQRAGAASLLGVFSIAASPVVVKDSDTSLGTSCGAGATLKDCILLC